MQTLSEILQQRGWPDVERRAFGRTTINRDVLMHFLGQEMLHACVVRNVTNHGAGLSLNGLNIVPSDFSISFDGFRTVRQCKLIWRDRDFLGAAFES